MKNINYIVNGILAAAVIVLFVLFLTDKSTGTTTSGKKVTDTTAVNITPSSIAFFDMDSVLANWDLYYQVQEEMATKQQSLEADFQNKSQGFQKRVEDAQYKIQRGLVTRAEAEQLQQQLASEEQNLVNLQNSYGAQLQEEGLVKNRRMLDNIEQYLKQYNEEKGYQFIFSYAFGGNLMYGDKAYDITREIIQGINKAYPVVAK